MVAERKKEQQDYCSGQKGRKTSENISPDNGKTKTASAHAQMACSHKVAKMATFYRRVLQRLVGRTAPSPLAKPQCYVESHRRRYYIFPVFRRRHPST